MKKIIAIILIIIGIFIIYKAVTHFTNRPKIVPAPVETQIKLPEGWQKIAAPAGTAQKYVKTVTSGIKPEIVLIDSASADATNSAKYTDRLIAGAKSALPSLRIATDETKTTPSLFSRFLSGYYYNQNTKINLLQRIYINGTAVSVITASYDPRSANPAEINSIFDLIWSQHPAN